MSLRAILIAALACGLLLAPVASAAPVAKITATKTTVGANEEVTFSASASTADADKRIVTYQWTFGDGKTASGVRVAHNFTQNGKHNVTLTIVDSTGARATDSVTVNVLAPQSTGPKLTHAPVATAKQGEPVVVRVTAAAEPAARIVQVFYETASGFVNVSAQRDGDAWTATIPADAVKPGLSYYVTALDADNKQSRIPEAGKTYDVDVQAPAPTTTTTDTSSPTPEAKSATPGAAVPLVLVAVGLLALARRR